MKQLTFLAQAALAAAALLSACAQAAEVPRYRVELAQTNSWDAVYNFDIRGLNNLGQLVGMRLFEDGQYTGYVYDGSFRKIDVPDARRVEPWKLNDRGDVIGIADPWEGSNYTFRYNVHSGQHINPTSGLAPQVKSPVLWAVNQAGHVLGTDVSNESWRHFLYDGNQSRYLDLSQITLERIAIETYALNDKDVVLGSYWSDEDLKRIPFTYDHGVLNRIPASSGFRSVYALNNDGHIVGDGHVSESVVMPFVYRDGVASSLGGLGGLYFGYYGGTAYDLNDQDWIVGQAATSESQWAAFLYRDGQMHDLNALLPERDAAQWDLTGAFEINERGQILATGNPADDLSARTWFLLSPVPEAQTWALMLAGLGLVGAVARRRSRPRAALS